MFGKVNPTPAVSKSTRMVFRSLPAPLKLFKTIKTTQKHYINEKLFFPFFVVFGPKKDPFLAPSCPHFPENLFLQPTVNQRLGPWPQCVISFLLHEKHSSHMHRLNNS